MGLLRLWLPLPPVRLFLILFLSVALQSSPPPCLAILPFTTNNKGGVITLSGGDDWDTDPGGALILRNSTFTDNLADLQNAGVVNLGDFSELLVEGDGNVFSRNVCGAEGAVFGSTTDTRLVVEGGEFYENEASDVGAGLVGQSRCLMVLLLLALLSLTLLLLLLLVLLLCCC